MILYLQYWGERWMIDNKYVSRLSKHLDRRVKILVHFLAVLSVLTALMALEWLTESSELWLALFYISLRSPQKHALLPTAPRLEVVRRSRDAVWAEQCTSWLAHTHDVPRLGGTWAVSSSVSSLGGLLVTLHLLGWLYLNFPVRNVRLRWSQSLSLDPFLSQCA